MHKDTIAVDLDGTLAFDAPDGVGPGFIGQPVPAMLDRVRQWLDQGEKVVIFTARLNAPDAPPRQQGIELVQDWLEQQGLPRLRVTDKKLWAFREMWDDRAIQVIADTGVAPLEHAGLAER